MILRQYDMKDSDIIKALLSLSKEPRSPIMEFVEKLNNGTYRRPNILRKIPQKKIIPNKIAPAIPVTTTQKAPLSPFSKAKEKAQKLGVTMSDDCRKNHTDFDRLNRQIEVAAKANDRLKKEKEKENEDLENFRKKTVGTYVIGYTGKSTKGKLMNIKNDPNKTAFKPFKLK
jgi:hypothetical protein